MVSFDYSDCWIAQSKPGIVRKELLKIISQQSAKAAGLHLQLGKKKHATSEPVLHYGMLLLYSGEEAIEADHFQVVWGNMRVTMGHCIIPFTVKGINFFMTKSKLHMTAWPAKWII